jgi:hypothetical protein
MMTGPTKEFSDWDENENEKVYAYANEVADLMADPTETLFQIRRKGEAEHVLSKAEWMALLTSCSKALRLFRVTLPAPFPASL